MIQITQNLKSGMIELSEVPFPSISPDKILVRNHFSLISAGTESKKISVGQKNYLGKAKEKPEQVKQVIDTIKKEGLITTYNKVMNKLDSLSPLGYSSAGTVIGVGDKVSRFKIGDRVSCAGQDIANHAEIVAVPENLAAKIPDNVEFESASYTTLGAIAMQGVRQADLRLGESCVVIGLGLLGQLTIQLLKASGIKPIGVDIDQKMVELSLDSGAFLSYDRNNEQLERGVFNISGGYGVDAVIITAGTSSLDPVDLAGKLCRTKGKVVVVGAVPTGFSRDNYYKKELELRMSCSYGPGRYNHNYEEKGLDYPIGYVRWTENRNMLAFLDLISAGYVNVRKLTTHTFDLHEAVKAYDLILEKSEPYIGILLKYDTDKELSKDVFTEVKKYVKHDVKVSFIGAGSFAQNYLLPNIKNADLVSVSTATSHNSKNIASKYGFKKACADSDDIIAGKESNTVFIATRHNLHAEFVIKAIKAGKNVFVEKPLCMNEAELEDIREVYKKQDVHLMVGFNRRFSSQVLKIKNIFSSSRLKAINYRINAGFIPPEHWIQDKEIGGGRIVGEVCHFVDLAMFLAGSLPSSLSAFAMEDSRGLLDTLTVNLNFKNGSVAAISYFANGSKELKKEYLEVFSGGVTAVLDDFKELHIYGKKKKSEKLMGQDKGHKNEVESFLTAVKNGDKTPIPFEEIYYSTRMSFDIVKSIQTNSVIHY